MYPYKSSLGLAPQHIYFTAHYFDFESKKDPLKIKWKCAENQRYIQMKNFKIKNQAFMFCFFKNHVIKKMRFLILFSFLNLVKDMWS